MNPDAAGPEGTSAAYSVSLTTAGVVLGVLSLVLVGVALQTGSLPLAAMGVLGFAMLAVSFVLRPSMGWGLALDGPLRCVEHEPVEHVGLLSLAGRAASPPARLTVLVDGFAAVTLNAPALRAGATREVRLLLRPQRRGRTRWVDVTATSDAPFGLVRRSVRVRTATDGIVHPARHPVTALPAAGRDGERPGRVPDRRGLPFHGVRELRRGDGARDVHWRSTAKRGVPVVLEREQPEGDDVLVLVVGPSAPPGTNRAWERLIGTAAWSVATALAEGRRPRLVVLDPARSAGEPARDGDPRLDPLAVLDAFALLDLVVPLRPQDVTELAADTPPGTPVVVFAPRHAVEATRAWVGAAFSATGRPATVVTS